MTTTQTAVNPGVASLSMTHGMLSQMIDTLSGDQMVHQPIPEANHALWIMGHMAYSDDYFLAQLSDESSSYPDAWKELFKDGSTPQPKTSAYPPVDEVRAKYVANRQRLLKWAESLDEEALNRPTPEDWQAFAPTVGAIISSMAAHEGMHIGQLTIIRKSLGMKPVMG